MGFWEVDPILIEWKTVKSILSFSKGNLTFNENVIKDIFMKIVKGYETWFNFYEPKRTLKDKIWLTIAKRRLTTRNIHVLYAIVSNFNLTVIQIWKKGIHFTKGICVHKTSTKVKICNRGVHLLQDTVPAHNAKYQIYHNVIFFPIFSILKKLIFKPAFLPPLDTGPSGVSVSLKHTSNNWGTCINVWKLRTIVQREWK